MATKAATLVSVLTAQRWCREASVGVELLGQDTRRAGGAGCNRAEMRKMAERHSGSQNAISIEGLEFNYGRSMIVADPEGYWVRGIIDEHPADIG